MTLTTLLEDFAHVSCLASTGLYASYYDSLLTAGMPALLLPGLAEMSRPTCIIEPLTPPVREQVRLGLAQCIHLPSQFSNKGL